MRGNLWGNSGESDQRLSRIQSDEKSCQEESQERIEALGRGVGNRDAHCWGGLVRIRTSPHPPPPRPVWLKLGGLLERGGCIGRGGALASRKGGLPVRRRPRRQKAARRVAMSLRQDPPTYRHSPVVPGGPKCVRDVPCGPRGSAGERGQTDISPLKCGRYVPSGPLGAGKQRDPLAKRGHIQIPPPHRHGRGEIGQDRSIVPPLRHSPTWLGVRLNILLRERIVRNTNGQTSKLADQPH